MFDTVDEVIEFYKKNDDNKNHVIYEEFKNNLQSLPSPVLSE